MFGVISIICLFSVTSVFADEVLTKPLLRAEVGTHTASINKAVITRDGRLLTVSDDKTARLWNFKGGPSLALRIPIGSGNEGVLYAAAASPREDRAVVAGWTGISWDDAAALYTFDLTTGKIIGRTTVRGTVHSLAYSKDGRYFAVGTGGGRPGLYVIDRDAKSIAALDIEYRDDIEAIEFLPDGRLVTTSLDGEVRLYNTNFRRTGHYTLPNNTRPWRIAVAPGGDRLAVGSLDAPVLQILSTDKLQPLVRLAGDRTRQGTFSVAAWVGTKVFAAGTYGDSKGTKFLRTWDLVTDKQTDEAIANDTVTDLVPLPDGMLAFTTAEPSLGTVDFQTGSVTPLAKRLIADFRDAFEGTFRVTSDGSVVDFGMRQGGLSPVRYDLINRSLINNPPPRPDMTAVRIPPDIRDWQNGTQPSYKGRPIVLENNEQSRSVAAALDGSRILLGADYSLRLMRGQRILWKIPLAVPAWAVNLTDDGEFAVAGLGDGTIRWYNARDGSEIVALLALTDGRWIAWTPEGYFDHADNAQDLVGYHINHGKAASPGFVSSGQLHSRFYRPDLLALKVRGENLSTALANTGDAQTVVTEHLAPTLDLLAWCVTDQCHEFDTVSPSGEIPIIDVDGPEITLRIGVTDRGSGIGEVVVRRDQAAVLRGLGRQKQDTGNCVEDPTVVGRGLARQKSTKEKSFKTCIEEHTVVLVPGDNLLTVTAFDGDQVVDAGEQIRLQVRYATAVKSEPELYVLTVGINYRNTEIAELANAVNDARGIAEDMAAHHELFKNIHENILLEEQATLDNIRSTLAQISREVKPNDMVLVFLAGHGTAIDGQYYFIPYDIRAPTPEAVKRSGLTHDMLGELLSTLPTSHTAVLVDTCYAGAFAVPDAILRHAQDRTWVRSLGYTTGRFILAGTTNEQEALDGIEGHGVFTAVILDALRGQADTEVQGNRDGRVDVHELARYAELRVPEKVKLIAPSHQQKPSWYFAGSDIFNITKVEAAETENITQNKDPNFAWDGSASNSNLITPESTGDKGDKSVGSLSAMVLIGGGFFLAGVVIAAIVVIFFMRRKKA